MHNLRERALKVIRLAQALARLDPRPEGEYASECDETIDKMLLAAKRFDAAKVRVDQLARSASPAEG